MSSDSKALRRYQAGVERALGLFDATHEWADYIAFLSRLHKALFARPEGDVDVPCKTIVARHLAQCLNPSLPSGVHQKALELYGFIFNMIGVRGLTRDLSLYLPGFAHTLAFASLSIRPLFLSLIEDHVLKLSSSTLRPALKAILLSLLPGLEEHTSDDFEATLATVNRIREIFRNDSAEGLFWQSLFLSSITNAYRRSGVLVYLARYLPKFGLISSSKTSGQNDDIEPHVEPSVLLSPEPGLLIRCFSSGLQDGQILIQRGFLDLLVTHLPLNAGIFQHDVKRDDLDILITAAMAVVLRRDMGLNRRLWTWFVGPEMDIHTNTEGDPDSREELHGPQVMTGQDAAPEVPHYSNAFGLPPLIRCFRKLVSRQPNSATERARPFRIGLSLMDRWEIGGPVVHATFIPLLQSLYDYQQIAKSQQEYDELFRSANVFFDGVESHLIWSQIFVLVELRNLDLLEFILSHFNLQEEEMLGVHIPMSAVALSIILVHEDTSSGIDSAPSINIDLASRIVRILQTLVGLVPSRVFDKHEESRSSDKVTNGETSKFDQIKHFYGPCLRIPKSPYTGVQTGKMLLENMATYFLTCFKGQSQMLPEVTQILSMLISKISDHRVVQDVKLLSKQLQYLEYHAAIETALPYNNVSSTIIVLKAISAQDLNHELLREQELLTIIPLLLRQLWPLLSPQNPQYHVEVSQSLWDLHKISKNHHSVESAILNLMLPADAHGPRLSEAALSHFAVLWSHIGTTVKTQSPDDILSMLKQPLLFTIDSLGDVGKEWLQNLPTALPLYNVILQCTDVHSDELVVHLRRLQNVMGHQSKDQWHQLGFADDESGDTPVARVLKLCYGALAKEDSDVGVERVALSIIRSIYGQSQPSTVAQDEDILNLLTKKLTVAKDAYGMDAPLLETLTVVLGNRKVNSEMLTCLLRGILLAGSDSIDKWISTLCQVVPAYGDSIFQVVIKITEEFCSRMKSLFARLSSLYVGTKMKGSLMNGTRTSSSESANLIATDTGSLEKAILNLFAGLEYILARAHERLSHRETDTAASRSPDQPQGIFGNIITGNQTQSLAEASQLRGSMVNDRLTVVLCFQDFIRICVHVWSWGSSGQIGKVETRASFHYMSSKIRVRARRILENLLEAEPQECLETIIEIWVKAVKSESSQNHELVLRLLQTLNSARPRIMMPATFNAIYNRTNPAALDKHQKSTMSTDVSALELLAFLIEYTKALEDDLLDEIWADCTTFLKDVLGNPMPHRQTLLRLLDFIAVLCSKMENTNFGEESKMRRELGDLCIRLFTAIFTIKPGGEDLNPGPTPVVSDRAHVTTPPYLGPGNSLPTLCRVLPVLGSTLTDSDRMTTAVSGIIMHITGPVLRSKAFHQSATPELFSLLELTSKSSGASKLWKRDVLEAFNDARFFQTPTELAISWLPVIRHLLTSEKQLMSELLTRLTAPTTAGLVFGVGATAARTEADRKTQLILKRVSVLVMAGEMDSFAPTFRQINTRVEELLTATSASSPSSTTRTDLYVLIRALVLKISPIHLSPLWPMIDAELRTVFSTILEDADKTYSSSARLQAAKLLDLLLLLKPDEFQLHEWLYVTDTVDAVYPPNGWAPTALIDQIAQERAGVVEGGLPSLASSDTRKPWLCSEVTRTTAAEDIDSSLLQPFFSQLSIHAFEDVYGLRPVDLEACEVDLLADLFEI